jgi:Tfp pilus assembly protein PilW
MRAAIDRLRRRTGDDDAGISLIEVLTAMVIFTVVVSISFAGIVIMTRNTVRSQQTTASADDLRLVFQRLDRQVRYAEAINYPGVGPSGARYVEFRTGATVSKTGVAVCSQWRYVPSTQTLQRRQWNDGAGASPGAWTTVVTHVVDDSTATPTTYPFAVSMADKTSHPHQVMTLRVKAGRSTVPAGADTQTALVARNSSDRSLSNADNNHDGVSDTPVCTTGTNRP